MSIQAVIRDIASIANVLSVVVLAVGYYFMIRLYREWVRQNRESREAGGRPMVVVAADYDHLPRVDVVVRNFNSAPAKDVTFDFSAPVESSDGFVLSGLPFFERGLPFLEPNGRISCYWEDMPSLAPLLERKGLEDGIRVTTRYKDLAGESYETEWTINPLLFAADRIETSKGMNDLVNAVEKIPGDAADGRHRRGNASKEG